MTDDEIYDEFDEDVPELPPEDPITAMLEGLDTLEGIGAPGETPPAASALSRREIDDLVDEVLDDELKRLSARKG
jgi:hypothetical protein